MKSDVLKRLTALEGPRESMPRLLLVADGDGYRQMGTGRTYTAQEAQDLDTRGQAQLIVLRVVYHDAPRMEG